MNSKVEKLKRTLKFEDPDRLALEESQDSYTFMTLGCEDGSSLAVFAGIFVFFF